MTNQELIELHRKLAEHHENEAKRAILDIVHEHHDGLAGQLRMEADRLEEFCSKRNGVRPTEDGEFGGNHVTVRPTIVAAAKDAKSGPSATSSATVSHKPA